MKKIILLFCFIHCSVFADNIMCKSGENNLYAVFTKNTYFCDNDEYLPADTLGCRSCPDAYICNAGTYTFNENEYQGIVRPRTYITHSLNDMCSINSPHELVAVFTPNIITLNWDDGTNITTTQCTFGETITIPNPPTRPGYKFGGWRVKRRN